MIDYLVDNIELIITLFALGVLMLFVWMKGYQDGQNSKPRTFDEIIKDGQVSEPRTLYEKIKYKISSFFRPPNY